jgi:uncharacterized protein (DUF58 family)
MIVPRNRLLFWFAVVALPFALLGAVEPGAGAISVVAIGGLVTLAVADAVGTRVSLAGISVRLPEVARMSKDHEARLEVLIRNERLRAKTLRLALALPREIESPQEDAWVNLPGDSEWSRFTWPCRPRRRGNYRVASAHLEADSPLGFWGARRQVPAPGEIRVYPDLFTERRSLAALFLHRGTFGLHAQRQVGKGREFEKLREYVPGDSFDDIHWKATAKRGRPVTKVYQIERTQEVYVIIDASRLSARAVPTVAQPSKSAVWRVSKPAGWMAAPPAGKSATQPVWKSALPDAAASLRDGDAGWHAAAPPPATILERYVTAALVLGLAAEQQGDLFGLLTFSDQVNTFVRARNGHAHFSTCRDALYTLQPKVVTPDYDELATFIRLRLRRRALLVFLTSLDDPVLVESFTRNIDLLRRQHLVVVNMLQPPGVRPVFSDSNVASLDELYQHLGGHLRWQHLRELEKVLQRRGVRFSLLQNERLSADLVSQYLALKQRQAL